MAAATSSVPMTTRPYDDVGVDRSLSVASAATYYLGSMICLNASRHAVKASDTAALVFDGIASAFNQGLGYLAVATTDTLGEKKVRVERPHTFGMKIAAAVLADIGREVYALYDNEVAYRAGSTNKVFVGWVDEVVNSTYVNVRPWWMGPAAPDVNATATQTALTDTATVTIAQILNRWLDGTPTAAATYTLPTAALLVAGIPNARVGMEVEFLINNKSGGANTITVEAGSGGTADGTLTVAQNVIRTFKILVTNVTASSEAYFVYGIG